MKDRRLAYVAIVFAAAIFAAVFAEPGPGLFYRATSVGLWAALLLFMILHGIIHRRIQPRWILAGYASAAVGALLNLMRQLNAPGSTSIPLMLLGSLLFLAGVMTVAIGRQKSGPITKSN